jgi:hypothetical protein
MLFIFDPDRAAIFLVAGDKAGQWSRWYEEAIPLAEARYADYRARRTRRAVDEHRARLARRQG